jgi:hypothetical protein
MDYLEVFANRQIGKEWSDTVIWYDQLFYCLHLLQGVTVQCLEFFIFVMEEAGKKQQRVVLMTTAKMGLSMRLLGTLRYVLTHCCRGVPLIKYPQFLDILRTLNVKHLNGFLVTILTV